MTIRRKVIPLLGARPSNCLEAKVVACISLRHSKPPFTTRICDPIMRPVEPHSTALIAFLLLGQAPRAPGQPAPPREARREKGESPDGALSASRRALNLFVSFRPFFRVLAAAHGRAGRRVYFLCAARGAIGHGAGAGIDALVDRCVGVPDRKS